MTLKQWSAWMLTAGITTLIASASIDFKGGSVDRETVSISLANMTKAQKDAVVRSEISHAKDGDEVISLRSSRGKVHKSDGNKLVATIGTKRQHYLDPDDSLYKTIDLTVKEISALAKINPLKKFDEYVDAGVYRATWLKEKPHDYTVYCNDSYVKFTFIGSLTNINVKNKFTGNGVKQTYVIKERPEHNILQWLVETDGNLVADGAGGFKVETNGGSTPMWIMPPVASDAEGHSVIVSTSIKGDTLTFGVTEEIGRKYPVTIDPDIIAVDADDMTGYLRTLRDTYLAAHNTTSADNVYSTNIMFGQYYVGAGNIRVYRALFRFDTSSLPDVINIDSTKVKMVLTADNSTYDFDMRVCDTTDSLAVGYLNTSMFNEIKEWAASGAYSPTYLSDTIVNTNGKSVGDTLSFTFNSTGIYDINKTGTTQFWILSAKDIASTSPASGGMELVEIEDDSPYLHVWYTIIPPNAPANFVLSNPTTATLDASWTNNCSDDIDSLSLYTSPDSWVKTVDSTHPVNSTTTTIAELSPNTQYIYKVRADSGTVYSVSNLDTLYTLAATPTEWAFTGASTTSISPAFEGNENPAGTIYAIRDSTRQVWIAIDGSSNGQTKAWQTEAQWETITISGLSVGTQYCFGIVGKNGDNIETDYLWSAVYTLSAVPGPPVLTAISPFSIHFIIAPEENPSYTQYALQDSITGLYADGSAEPETLRVGPPGDWGWKTFSQWGGVQGDTLMGLFPDSLYVFRVKARIEE